MKSYSVFMIEQAVVLGASGGMGKAIVDALIKKNIPTKILVRDIEKFKSLYPDEKLPGRVNVMEGDMNSNQALAVVCEHSDVIFPCFSTSYSKYDNYMPIWISKVADIAAALGARIVFPGNKLVYARTDARRITEEHPQRPKSRIGQLTIAVEQRLARAVAEGASLSIIRFPFIFGPAALNSFYSSIFEQAIKRKICAWKGNNPSLEYEFMYSADAGEVMVRAAMNPQAADTILHHPGQLSTPQDFIKLIYSIEGMNFDTFEKEKSWKANIRSAFSKDAEMFHEVKYIFNESLILDGSKFKSIVGEFSHTPIETAIKQTLDWYRYWFKV
ncbi:MAG: NAD-dependent epimerase/dehydratase family protein [Candidatus Heimdallarchaeota archaeon]|nr:NAD-dependent epimerase/dehydratase family protein [Candidatus Heimdallarchaeota archaeon]